VYQPRRWSNIVQSLVDLRWVISAVTKPRRKTRWNLLECRKLTNRSQPLVGRCSPYCDNMWRRYCCLTSFSDCRYLPYSCEDIAQRICVMVRKRRIFASCIFQPANLRLLRIGENKRRRKKEETTAILGGDKYKVQRLTLSCDGPQCYALGPLYTQPLGVTGGGWKLCSRAIPCLKREISLCCTTKLFL